MGLFSPTVNYAFSCAHEHHGYFTAEYRQFHSQMQMKLMLVTTNSMLGRYAIPGGSSVLDELILLCDSISLQEKKMLSSRHLTTNLESFWRISNIWRIAIMEILLEIFFSEKKIRHKLQCKYFIPEIKPRKFHSCHRDTSMTMFISVLISIQEKLNQLSYP